MGRSQEDPLNGREIKLSPILHVDKGAIVRGLIIDTFKSGGDKLKRPPEDREILTLTEKPGSRIRREEDQEQPQHHHPDRNHPHLRHPH